MPLTAEQLGEAVDELRFQDKQNGLPEEHIGATIQRVTAMGPVKAQMLAIKAIWDSIELGKEWARTPEGIARQIGREIAGKAPLAIRAAKKSFQVTEYLPLHEGYRFEQSQTVALAATEDTQEAWRAFAEKRKPVFKGR